MRRMSIGTIAGLSGFFAVIGAILVWPALITGQVTNRLDRIGAALEAYALDNNGTYPSASTWGTSDRRLPHVLTTPISYLQAADLLDPFAVSTGFPYPYLRYTNVEAEYGKFTNPTEESKYRQLKERHGSWIVRSGRDQVWNPETTFTLDLYRYDPTNGTQARNAQRFPMVHSFRSQRMRTETGLESF